MLHWIEKKSSHGCALEYLESSGTKIMMCGPIVHQLYELGNREKRNQTKMNFFIFHTLTLIFCATGLLL